MANQPDVPDLPTNIHTPLTLANIFSNLIAARQERDVLFIQGVYQATGRKNYGGMFYDQLRDEIDRQVITIKVPELLRPRLTEGRVYVLKGYLERKVKEDSSIGLTFAVVDCVSEQRPVVTGEAAKVAELLRLKADEGYIDVGARLKQKLLLEQRPQVALIYGHAGIVSSDVKGAIREAVASYAVNEHRINLAQKQEIIQVIKGLDKTGLDLLAIVRGGGSGLDIFNDPEIAQAAIDVAVPFAAAIGHAEDVTLLERVADKKFATPTALGNFLRELVEQAAEERIGSRAKLAADLEQTYRGQIESLKQEKEQLESDNSWMAYSRKELKDKNAALEKRQKQVYLIVGIVIIVSLIVGIVIGATL